MPRFSVFSTVIVFVSYPFLFVFEYYFLCVMVKVWSYAALKFYATIDSISKITCLRKKRNNYKFEQSNIIISTYRVREQPTTLLRASQVNVDE